MSLGLGLWSKTYQGVPARTCYPTRRQVAIQYGNTIQHHRASGVNRSQGLYTCILLLSLDIILFFASFCGIFFVGVRVFFLPVDIQHMHFPVLTVRADPSKTSNEYRDEVHLLGETNHDTCDILLRTFYCGKASECKQRHVCHHRSYCIKKSSTQTHVSNPDTLRALEREKRRPTTTKTN